MLSQGFKSLTITWNTPQSPNGIILHYTVRVYSINKFGKDVNVTSLLDKIQ